MIIFEREFGNSEVFRGSVKNQVYDVNLHIHQFCEIIYVFSGALDLTVDGAHYQLSEGEISVITPFQMHEIHSIGKARFWMCVFSTNCVPDHNLEIDFFRAGETPLFSASELLRSQINALIKKLKHPIKITEGVVPRAIKSVLYSAFCEFCETVEKEGKKKKRDVLSAIFLYVNEHYLERITLISVGKALGYNPKYLSQCLSSIPDMSFTILLNSLRIDRAKNLLLGTNYTVEKIAFECGFENEQSFYRTFSRIVGATPGKYRSSLR